MTNSKPNLLTQEQVDNLPAGTEIAVLWAGDMTDTTYTGKVFRDIAWQEPDGTKSTCIEINGVYDGSLVNVGKDSHNNWVWLTVKEDKPVESDRSRSGIYNDLLAASYKHLPGHLKVAQGSAGGGNFNFNIHQVSSPKTTPLEVGLANGDIIKLTHNNGTPYRLKKGCDTSKLPVGCFVDSDMQLYKVKHNRSNYTHLVNTARNVSTYDDPPTTDYAPNTATQHVTLHITGKMFDIITRLLAQNNVSYSRKKLTEMGVSGGHSTYELTETYSPEDEKTSPTEVPTATYKAGTTQIVTMYVDKELSLFQFHKAIWDSLWSNQNIKMIDVLNHVEKVVVSKDWYHDQISRIDTLADAGVDVKSLQIIQAYSKGGQYYIKFPKLKTLPLQLIDFIDNGSSHHIMDFHIKQSQEGQ